jgi:hypothetical protein
LWRNFTHSEIFFQYTITEEKKSLLHTGMLINIRGIPSRRRRKKRWKKIPNGNLDLHKGQSLVTMINI